MKKRNNLSPKAFTLMELLVVIAIIALLMSIITPALQKVKSQARRVVCASQIRQMTFGALMYAESNKDKFLQGPYLHFVSANAYASILRYTGCMEKAKGPDANGNYPPETVKAMQYAGRQLFVCPNYQANKQMKSLPAFAAKANSGWIESAWQIGYVSLVGFGPNRFTDWTSALKTTDKPLGKSGDDPTGRLPLFADWNNQASAGYYVRVAHPLHGKGTEVTITEPRMVTPVEYDMAGSNISFLDGAVEWRKASEAKNHTPGYWW